MPVQTEHRFPLRPKRPGRRRQPSHPGPPARPGTGGGRVLHAHRHRTPLLQPSGLMLVDSAGVVRYRPATALPTGSFDGPTLQAAIDRP